MALIKNWVPTVGTVVSINKFMDSEIDKEYQRVVEYNVDGIVYTRPEESFISEAWCKDYQVGDKLEIVYNPDNPKKFILAKEQKWKGIKQIIGLVFWGLVLLIIVWIWLLFNT